MFWKYLKKQLVSIILFVVLLVGMSLYLFYLGKIRIDYLLYLDIVLIIIGLIVWICGYKKYKKIEIFKQENKFLTVNDLKEKIPLQYLEIIEKNEEYYQKEINYYNLQIFELLDYLHKWSRETKLPLAAMRLINERNQDKGLKKEMRLALERFQMSLNNVSMYSNLKDPDAVFKIEKITLAQTIKEAVKHHSYLLINDNFIINLDLLNEYVYSNRRYLTFIFEQLISNSIKYKKENPEITFRVEQSNNHLQLFIEDNGIGIPEKDIPYIFDYGYIGNDLKTLDYRPLGMGLYFVKEIAKTLDIKVSVDGDYKDGSRFILEFKNYKEK